MCVVFGDPVCKEAEHFNEAFRVGLTPYDWCPKGRGHWIQTSQREAHVKAAIHKPRRESSKGTHPADALILDFSLLDLLEKKCLSFKSPPSAVFVMAARANKYR